VGSHPFARWHGRQLAIALSVQDAPGTGGVHPRLTGRS
jgi:hypothetical protein